MTDYNRKDFLFNRRKELGISRLKLSDEICDISTLVRYELGDLELIESKYEKMQDKLQQPCGLYTLPYEYGLFVDLNDYKIYEDLLCNKEFDKLLRELPKIEKSLEQNTGIEKTQFISRIKLLILEKKDSQRYLSGLIELIHLSVPEFDNGVFPTNRIYNQTELAIMNDIAIAYWQNDRRDVSLLLLDSLLEYSYKAINNIDDNILNKFYINYSSFLGQDARFIESIEVAVKGIEWKLANSTQVNIYNYYFNIGWSLHQLFLQNRIENYFILAKKYIKMSLNLCIQFNESSIDQRTIRLYFNNMHI